MSNEVMPFVLGCVVGVLARRSRGATPMAMRVGVLAACLTGVTVTIASDEFAIAPVLLVVDAALAVAGFASAAVAVHWRTAARTATARSSEGTA